MRKQLNAVGLKRFAAVKKNLCKSNKDAAGVFRTVDCPVVDIAGHVWEYFASRGEENTAHPTSKVGRVERAPRQIPELKPEGKSPVKT